MRRGIVIGGMVLGLLMGCNNGMAELEKKSSFYESVVKIGHEFQEIFGIFGNAMGEALGFGAVKSDSKKSEVGEHFGKIKKGLEGTKNKLNELSGKISEAKNADGNTTKIVNEAIKSASDVFDKLLVEVDKLADVTKKDGTNEIGDNHTSAAVGANAQDVNEVVKSVKAIIKAANDSGIQIDKRSEGEAVPHGGAQTNAPAALGGTARAGAGDKLAAEISKSDPWAIIDKINNAKVTDGGELTNGTNGKDLGALAAGSPAGDNNNGSGAATNADLVAAVALKAMIKGGKFSATAGADAKTVKAAVASAVNKVLGVLDEIIRRTVNHELGKVKNAVKEIKYSETTGTNATEANTSTK